jgi:Lon protease-like protein
VSSGEYELAMFPLGLTLVPGAALPLRLFEPRYRVLVHDMQVGDIPREFGTVLIDRGREVGGGDVRFAVGCVAKVVHIQPLNPEETQWHVVAVGDRRIRVQEWLPEDPYPRARVADWRDPEPAARASELLARAHATLRRLLALVAELGRPVPELDLDLDHGLATASFQLLALAPLGDLDRMKLLAASSVEERLEQLDQLLEEETALLARRLAGG